MRNVAWDPEDRHIYPDEPPVSWGITVRDKATQLPINLTGKTITAAVYNNGVLVSPLVLDRQNETTGQILITLTPEVYALMAQFTVYRLRVSGGPSFMVQGRLVKET